MKKNDLVATPEYESTMQNFALGTLKTPSVQNVYTRSQAKEVASQNSNQSYNDKRKSDMKTIIPSSVPNKIIQVPKMQQYVHNRRAGSVDKAQTKAESAKKHNAEFFKKQSDRKYL